MRGLIKHRLIGLVALLLIISNYTIGQDTISKRPEVGFVLSGGAAKGLSQIGVLKVLESEGIYPDIITGCSMGGIIGGLYSIGYSPFEIDSIVNTLSWPHIFNDDIFLNRIAITEKRYYNNNILDLQFDLHHKPSLPNAVIQGQNITEKLGELTWHAAGIDNFDSLCVPFRAVAADLVSSKLYYFSTGDIKTAIRATMAIPSVFSPVILDSMLLVDGGILNCFPVEEAKRVGADFIIGVYTSYNERAKIEDINSLAKILSRSAFITGVCDVRIQLDDVDILIRPDLKDYGPESFQKSKDIRIIGEKAALEKSDTLKQFARYLKQFPEKVVREIPMIDSFYITHVGSEGNLRIKESYITAWANISPNTWVSYPPVQEAVKKIYSTLHFDKVDYVLEKTEKGFALIFRVAEKRAGSLGLGAHYDNDFQTGIIVDILYRNLMLSADRFYTGVNISQNAQMRSDYTIYLGKRKRNYASFKVNAENTNLPHYYSIDTISSENGKIKQTIWNTSIGIGTMISQNSTFSVKGIYEWFDFRFSEGLDKSYGLTKLRYHNFRAKGVFELNTMDRAYFPASGVQLNASADYVLSDPGNYLKLFGAYDQMIRFHKLFSTGLQARIGWIGGTPLMYDQFYIGGDHFVPRKNMVKGYGLGIYSLNVSDFISFGMALQFNIKTDFYISAKANVFSLDNFSGSGFNAGTSIYGYGISIGYRSVIGPIKLSIYSNSENSDLEWLFNFSYPF